MRSRPSADRAKRSRPAPSASPPTRSGRGDGGALDWSGLETACHAALRAYGAGTATARILAAATVEAERHGRAAVGVAHLFDYLEALRSGRLEGSPRCTMTAPRAAVISVDADRGIAQAAFALARERLLGVGFIARLDAHFARLAEFIGHEFGRRRAPFDAPEIPAGLLERLTTAAQPLTSNS